MEESILVLIPKNPILNNYQLDRLSAIFQDIGQIAAGSIIIPYILDKPNTLTAATGIVIAAFFWLLSLKISGRILWTS